MTKRRSVWFLHIHYEMGDRLGERLPIAAANKEKSGGKREPGVETGQSKIFRSADGYAKIYGLRMPDKFLYIFLDESGNLDFSTNGSRFFLIGGIIQERPFEAYKALCDLRYDLIESGEDIHTFHATEDKQAVRDRVFAIVQKHLRYMTIDALVVEKRKTHPSLQQESRFYPEMLGYFLRHVLGARDLKPYQEVLVMTARLKSGARSKEFERTVKTTLVKMLPASVRWRVLHHPSHCNFDLQVADYCCWAIYRKWNNGDFRSYRLISSAIRREFDIFARGTKHYY